MKQAFAFILLLLVILSVVAFSWQPAEVEDGRLRLTWACSDHFTRREHIALFEKYHPNIAIEMDPANMDNVKVIIQSTAGVGPDLFNCFDYAQLAAFVKSDTAWDVTDQIRSWGVDTDKDLWNGGDSTFRYHDGRLYGFPLNVAVDCLWFHKGLLKAQGVTLPDGILTWDQFIPIAQELTLRDTNGRITQYGFGISWHLWNQYVWQMGGRMFSPDQTRCTLDTEEAVAGIQLMYDLIYKYRVSPTPSEEAGMASQGGWGAGLITQFGAKKMATAIGGRWWLLVLRDYEGMDLGVHEAPVGRERRFLAYGKSLMINAKSPRREESLELMKHLLTKPYHKLVNSHADGFGPLKQYAFDEDVLFNPEHPEEDYNHIWRDAMTYGEPEEVSPFVNATVAKKIVGEQLDLVKNGLKTPGEAMKTATLQINEEILDSIEEEPALKREYERRIRASNAGGDGS